MADINRLIMGKDLTSRVVSIEPGDGNVELFVQQEDGSIKSEFVSNKYWILSHKSHGPKWVRLAGNLHYKYGCQFVSRKEFQEARGWLRNEGAFSIYDAKESCLVNKGLTYFKGLKPKDVSVLSFDIETTGFSGTNDRLLLISNTYRASNGTLHKALFAYDDYKSEAEMLLSWTEWLRERNPSVICGHNIYGFDFPFLRDVATRENVTLPLGRNGDDLFFNSNTSNFRKDGSQTIAYRKVKCYGRELIDTMFLAIKYDIVAKRYESYGLKKIIEQEGIRFPGRQLYDASKIRENYKDPVEWEKIKRYCEHDSDEALALFDLMVPATFYLSQSVPKSFQQMVESATGSQINAVMTRSYIQEAHSLPKATENENFEGAISLGNPGIYKNVFKVDVASLYPSIMLQYEVFDKKKDPNGNFLNLLQTFTTERLKNKKLFKDTKDQKYDDLQNAQKIFINSCYGFLGAPGLLFNAPELAAFVTMKGREILQTAIDWCTGKQYKLVNADTDSISFAKANEEPFIKEECINELKELNSLYPERIHFEDDGLSKVFIVLKAKNYVTVSMDNKVKIKGSALKSSKTEQAIREMQNRLVEAIINETNDYKTIYESYVLESMNIKADNIKAWASKKSYTSSVDTSERTNETKIKDAIAGTNYKEGDKFWLIFREDESLCLIENFDGDYHKDKMLEKVFKSTAIFDSVLPTEELFINYKLKKNKKALDELLKL